MSRTLPTVLAGLILLCGVPGVGWSQTVRPDTATVSFTVDHVHVILRRNTANDVVAANIYLLGGDRQVTPATAGIEALMLAASEGGTGKYPRQALRAITGRLGATFVIQPSADWTTFGLRTLRQSFDSTWAVFADRLVAPRLDSAAVERARQQMLTEAAQSEADPDIAVARLAEGLLYANHPYRMAPGGTEESLGAITPSLVRRYHDSTVVQSRLLVIVVGNVDRGLAHARDTGHLGHLTRGHLCMDQSASTHAIGPATRGFRTRAADELHPRVLSRTAGGYP